jgi:NAD(P)-dependent dehydrogenase (short-subunit alcohol dehydrogenase family)
MGRQIVITGVAQGLGRALTEQFIALGHTVWGCDVKAAAIAHLQHCYPAPHHFQSVDVTVAEQVQRWASDRPASGCQGP